MRLKYELRIVDALSGLLSDAGSIPAASIPFKSHLFPSFPREALKTLYLQDFYFFGGLQVPFDSRMFPDITLVKTWGK